ncbi:MAG: prepilin-type N-terminal cleavage/methylation domain-containing protein [Candidatus Omnitrophica bacterium]|nr:prepilin-type N-terminal cleavage/methylation domain-containing protein [Candidatus Omnitrophota bacterium]
MLVYVFMRGARTQSYPYILKLRRSFSRGFTLVEILAAILVISVALVAVAGSLSLGNALLSNARQIFAAESAAQDQMELIRSMGFAAIVSTYAPNAAFATPGFAPLTDAVGTVAVDYPLGAAAPNNRLIRVTVTVAWTASGGRAMVRSLVSFFTEGGISG